MKILMYSDAFGRPTTTFIYNDVIGLARNNEVKYLCTAHVQSALKYDDVNVVEYKVNPLVRKWRWILERRSLALDFYSADFSKKVNKIISDFRPDIIQCNFGYEALRLADNLHGVNSKIPLVVNFLGYDASFHLNRKAYVRKLIALSKKPNVFATCNTYFLKSNLESKGIYFRENRVIHTGVRLDFFDRKGMYPEKKDEYIFLQISTMSQRKGQEITMQAYKRLLETAPPGQRYKLILAGGNEDEDGDRIRKIPQQLGIQDHVELIPWVSPEEAKELMMKAHCFVHHSRTINNRTEGIPTAISEAMAMELPVISTRHAGIPELVQDGVNGYLVKENDVETYYQRMKDIQSFPFLKINREKVNQRFNIVNRIADFEKYYAGILGKVNQA